MTTPLALKLENSGICVHLRSSAVKPRVDQIDLPTARRLHGADYLRQRKSDGRHETITIPGFEPLNCELMRDGSRRVNDVFIPDLDTRERWAELQRIAQHLPPGFEIEKSDVDLDDEIAAGGEGIVLKPWHQPFGIGWLKAKRSENFIVRVASFNGGTRSVFIEDAATREPRGKVALLGDRCERVREGSLLKLTGYGLTANGAIREPRPDADTATSWIVQY